MGKPLILFFTGQAPASIAGSRSTKDNVPTQRFIKDIIRVGTYTHPKDGWTKTVTADDLQKWAGAFGLMKSKGVDVEVVVDHDERAEQVRGYTGEMFVDGDVLKAALDQRGEAGIKLAQQCKTVSVWIEPEFKDGTGNNYGECITHVSFVTKPVVPNQSFAEAIAASLSGKAEPLIFSVGDAMDLDKLLKEIGSLLGVQDKIEPAKAVELLTARVRKDDTDSAAAKTKLDELTAQLSQKDATIGELNKKLTGDKTPPAADTLNMLAEGYESKLDGLVTKGKVTTAVAASLKKILVGEPTSRNAYAMSSSYSGRPTALAKEILDALENNDPVELDKTRTGAQGQRFSASGKPDTGDDKPLSKEDQEEMAKMAYGNKPA